MEHDRENDFTDEKVEYLIENGALTPVGVDEDGDRLFMWNPEVLKELEPELYQSIKEEAERETDDALRGLLEKGLVDIEYDDTDHDFSIIFTPEGEEWAEANGIELE